MTIKLKLAQRAAIIARVAPRLGASVAAGDGITVTLAGNVYTVAVDPAGGIFQPLDSDLTALAALSSTGVVVRTASGAFSLRTLTGTANEITVTNGSGVSGAPTFSLPTALTFTGKTVTDGTFSAPTIAGGTHTGITSLGIRDTSAAFDVTLAAVSSTALTAGRTLTLDMVNAARSIKLQGNVDLGGTLTTAGAASLPAIAQGDLWYGSASGVISALAKDTGTSRFLKNSGTLNNPAWAQPAASDLSNGTTGSGAVALAGSPTFTTQITSPLVIGGAAAASTLILESTSGTGTTDAIIFKTGSQVERLRLATVGNIVHAPGTLSTAPAYQINLNAATPPASPYTDRTAIQIVSAANTDTFSLLDAYGVSATHNSTPHILFRTARGSIASPSAVGTSLGGTYQAATGDYFGFIGAGGYGATGFSTSAMNAGIGFRPTQLQTDTARGGQTTILTTPNGTNSPVYSAVFDQGGDLKLGPNAVAMQAATAGTILQGASADGTNTFITIDAFGTSLAPGLLIRAARGTIAAPTASQSGDVLGQGTVLGYGATAYGAAAGGWFVKATQNWTDANQGARLILRTTPNSTNSVVNAVAVGESGGVAVGLGDVDTTAGIVNVLTGFRVNSAAASGNVLRGNGTNFVSSTLGVSDLSGAGTGVLTFLATPSSANLAAALTDETGSGKVVFDTSPTLVTPTLGAATATSLTFSPTTGGIVGTTTNDNAGAGKVGEYSENSVAGGSAISLTSLTAKDITNVSLTAGDWLVQAVGYFSMGGTTVTTQVVVAVHTTADTLPSVDNYQESRIHYGTGGMTGGLSILSSPIVRMSLASTTTVRAVALGQFATSTMVVSGKIRAWRVR